MTITVQQAEEKVLEVLATHQPIRPSELIDRVTLIFAPTPTGTESVIFSIREALFKLTFVNHTIILGQDQRLSIASR